MCGIKYSEVPCDSLKNASLQRMFKTVNSIKSRIAKKSNDMQYASDRLNENEQALTQVEHLMGLDVDIRSLMSCQNFKVTFGKLPLSDITLSVRSSSPAGPDRFTYSIRSIEDILSPLGSFIL